MAEPAFGYGFVGWLKAQVALLPLLILAGSAAIVLADSHNDDRYEQKADGAELSKTVDEVQATVGEIQKTQAVNAEKVKNIESAVQELKTGNDSIEAKLDRLIERQH